VIVIGAEPPTRIKGGGVLGGLAGSRPREIGEVTSYVMEKSPVRVLVTAPPDGAGEVEPIEDEDETDAGVAAR
jgi:nucleotide-binding universal stress UspA family protein